MPQTAHQGGQNAADDNSSRGCCCAKLLSCFGCRGNKIIPQDKQNDKEQTRCPEVPEVSEIVIKDGKRKFSIGAKLKTYNSSQNESGPFRHFIALAGDTQQKISSAEQMEIHDEDEVLLVQDTLVHFATHTEVQKLFGAIKVDGQTTNKLVVRRKETVETFEELHFKLAPGQGKEVTVLEHKSCKLKECDVEYTCMYKIPGTQRYLKADGTRLVTGVFGRDDNDRTMHFLNRTKVVAVFPGPEYFVTLKSVSVSRYISINADRMEVFLAAEPDKFRFKKLDSLAHFQHINTDSYLGYDDRKETVRPRRSEVFFEQIPV